MDQNRQIDYFSSLKGIYTFPNHTIGANEWENENCTQNGPFLGNGDMQAVLLGDRRDQIFYINKSDMWTDEDQDRNVRAVPTGGVALRSCLEESISGSFLQELKLWDARIRAVSEGGFTTDSFLAPKQNIMIIKVKNDLDRPLPLRIEVWAKDDDRTLPAEAGREGKILWAKRETSSGLRGKKEPARWVSYSAIAAAAEGDVIRGGDPDQGGVAGGNSQISLILKPREERRLCVCLSGGKNDVRAAEEAIAAVREFCWETVERLEEEHRGWWHDFWLASYVRVYDDTLDRLYYGALYLAACVNRAGFVPAGQYPFCRSDDPAWAGDYHMDQEYLGQNEGFFSSNRPELSGGAFGPLLDFMETGRLYAKTKMSVVHPDFTRPRRGILYPVGLGPWGVDSTVHDNGGEPWIGNMVSNASYTGMLFIWQYEYYKDRDWLRETGYPYIRELAEFWTSHIQLIGEKDGGGNYVLYGATWEESFGRNPAVDLGLVRTVLSRAVQYSLELNTDGEKRPVWNEILEHLPDYPTAVQNGKEVFVEYEGAEKFRGGCDLQMVYPAEAVSGITNPELIPVIHHTLAEDLKSMTKPFHTAIIAVRTGYPIDRILKALKESSIEKPASTWLGMRENFTLGVLHCNGEFLEFLDSCLLQSQDGVIRVFPGWYPDRPAEFYRLRAKGAFLVSAAKDGDGRLTELTIRSERGGICTVEAPANTAVTRDGKDVEAEYGELPCGIPICRFQTEPEAMYEIRV